MASLDLDDIGQICQLGLGKNLGLLQHDFNHILMVKGEMLPFLRCFSSLLSSDGDPWDDGCVVFPPWMKMKLPFESLKEYRAAAT